MKAKRICFIFLVVADIVMTIIALSNGFYETNTFTIWLMTKIPWTIAVSLHGLMVISVVEFIGVFEPFIFIWAYHNFISIGYLLI